MLGFLVVESEKVRHEAPVCRSSRDRQALRRVRRDGAVELDGGPVHVGIDEVVDPELGRLRQIVVIGGVAVVVCVCV